VLCWVRGVFWIGGLTLYDDFMTYDMMGCIREGLQRSGCTIERMNGSDTTLFVGDLVASRLK